MGETILIEKKYIDEYIIEKLSLNRIEFSHINNAKYHHNSSYNRAQSILKHGILSLSRMNDLGIVELTNSQMELLSDTTSHINGTNGISLSVVGLEDLYSGEEEYNPFTSQNIDFIISDSVKAIRFTQHYGNEFVTFDDVLLSEIWSLDFRIIKFIEENLKNRSSDKNKIYNDLIYKYNTILALAKQIKRNKLKIQLREMSNEVFNLNIDNICKMPMLIMKP